MARGTVGSSQARVAVDISTPRITRLGENRFARPATSRPFLAAADAASALGAVVEAAEVEVGDVRAVDDRGGVHAKRDRNDLRDLVARRALLLGLLEVTLEAALATGRQRRGDRDELLGLEVDLRLAVGRLVEAHVEALEIRRQQRVAAHGRARDAAVGQQFTSKLALRIVAHGGFAEGLGVEAFGRQRSGRYTARRPKVLRIIAGPAAVAPGPRGRQAAPGSGRLPRTAATGLRRSWAPESAAARVHWVCQPATRRAIRRRPCRRTALSGAAVDRSGARVATAPSRP